VALGTEQRSHFLEHRQSTASPKWTTAPIILVGCEIADQAGVLRHPGSVLKTAQVCHRSPLSPANLPLLTTGPYHLRRA
jgi:hypothetical protein